MSSTGTLPELSGKESQRLETEVQQSHSIFIKTNTQRKFFKEKVSFFKNAVISL